MRVDALPGYDPGEYFKTQKADFSVNEILLMFLGSTNNLEGSSHIDSYPLCMDSTLI